MRKIKKIIAVLNIILILFSCVQSSLGAVLGDDVTLYDKGECDYTLQANDGAGFYKLTCTYVEYIDKDGKGYPAYCINRGIDGIGEYYSYRVNLSELIHDDRLWRVAVNGYPNKSAQELGVENDFDAFFATKQAVYTILGNFNIDTHYRAVNARGEKIIAAIRAMVNEGLYGTATYDSPSVNVSKSGDLRTENIGGTEYLTQNYVVSSVYNLKSYEVELQNAPVGTKLLDVNGNEATTFTTNSFKLAIPYNSINNNINCVVRIDNAKVKTYPVFYGKTSLAGTQNYMVVRDPYETTSNYTTLAINTNNASVEIIKKDEQTGEAISNTVFTIYDNTGNQITTATTDNNGKAKFSNLYPGTYTIKETTANTNYVLNIDTINVNLKYGESKTIDFTNKKKTGKIKVIKVDKDNNEVKLEGVVFEILDKNNNVIQTLTTNSNGEATSKDLRIEEQFKVKEKTTKNEYVLSDKVETVVLKENEIKNLTFENEKKKGQLKIVKVDKDFNEIKLEGVVFEILDNNNKVVETLKTDSNGEAISKKLPIDIAYTIKEKETKADYKKTNETFKINLIENQIVTKTIENEKKKGSLKIIKVDKDNHKVVLGNVEFDLYSDEFKKVIGKFFTNVDGEIKIDNLRIGNYSLIEKITGKWYNLADDTEVKVIEDKTVDTTIENELKKGQVKVIKVDLDNNEVKLKDVEFNVFDENGNIVDTIKTNENGEAETKRLPINQNYTIQESKTLKNYVLSEEKQTLILTQDQITEITFCNEKIKGKVEITKVSKNDNKITKETKGTVLENAEFEIYNDKDKLVETLSTAKDGKATSGLLEYGKYYIKEINTGSDYYLLNTNKYEFEITENHKVIPVVVENESVDIGLDIDKNGIVQAQPNDEIKYGFNSLKNTSNVSLDNFTWTDNLPYEYVRITKLFTGTYNEDLDYIVKYKTNKSEEYIEYEKYNTQKNNYIDFTKVELAEDEFITDFKVKFGTVKAGFEAIEKPFIFAKVLPTVKAEDRWVNYTKLTGNYKDKELEDKAEWETTSYYKKLEIKKLPKTGF